MARDHRARGWSAPEIYYQHYGSLSLAQVYAALAYYCDNQAEFEAEIEKQIEESERFRSQTLDSPGRQRLRDLGKLP